MLGFVIAAVALAALPTQEKPAARLPEKGATIVVKGCLRGTALESTQTAAVDGGEPLMTTLVYRLTGDKSLLKRMRQEHDRSVVEVTGVLKSKLPADEVLGKTFGRTRVRIGVGSPGAGSQAMESSRSIPVLEVKDYEGVPVKCGG
jgi:hypothetical protein